MKRDLEDASDQPVRKRVRQVDRISSLSDEVLVRILSFLPIESLIHTQNISRKFNRIGGDSQLWKALYYDRFVRPRASRIPNLKESERVSEQLHFSSKISKWLDEENLVKRGTETNWKRQYKLRHNWAKGTCNVAELEVSEEPPVPSLLVRFHKGVIYTVDSVGGLRAFSAKTRQRLLACYNLQDEERNPPTAIAVDAQDTQDGAHRITIGFQNGRFSVYEHSIRSSTLSPVYTHPPSSNGAITAVALSLPFILTLSSTHLLSLYRFPSPSPLSSPHLLHSFTSQTVSPPVSLSLRQSPTLLTASIAYPVSSPFLPWKSGLQELRLSLTGVLLSSRTAVAHPRAGESSVTPSIPRLVRHSRPTALSYSHPYLLMAHPENTLTLSMVTSTPEGLAISAGRVLWGHLSAVTAAHVSPKGRAVSVGRGEEGEVRVWELEGFGGPRGAEDATSVIVDPGVEGPEEMCPVTAARYNRVQLWLGHVPQPGWVGFDEENVVVWKGREEGGQKVLIYNFA
ncbi:hypothetical protein P152DRAFT_508898 [Eremomyces bilateralis CBS 781.70]|uniref:F-box domain-containing protein n=1 Tax=Eremomyces bilateralis CBS 781.70 TaxID=1392243 RepID=A0A6G1FWG2_9PEZI|nr:uncharacterized protein P152DRAFT_508898 [Eremomyces bilateralis CBS 781.70]KAF1810020.1 hypothetical protein P152DRAFT_508898 [Eremomyces bilateralis CBS 781.70]